MDIVTEYKNYCLSQGIQFQLVDNVRPYDETTLFCPAGMQQYKKQFADVTYMDTVANIQPCIRLNDLDEIGDGSHLLYFNMMGLFSFRQMTVQQAIDFWIGFLMKIGVVPDFVTVHPDKPGWHDVYKRWNIPVVVDEDCKWSDGEIGGYCTEFFKYDWTGAAIEIGNIVNPLGSCIDVGFGLERLQYFITGEIKSQEDILKDTITMMLESGYHPSNKQQGYVLRKLLRRLYKMGGTLDHDYFTAEIIRQKNCVERYNRLKDKQADKSREWWLDTHGVDIDDL